ncbi:MAG: ABC transporter permease [Acidobacteria bacterium]|nr:ABC transporter permease [Acidobacteriota bacterium]
MNLSPHDLPSPAAPTESKQRSIAAIWEACVIAVDSIWTHKLRSVLTLLGIIIAIASVVTVGGAIEGLGGYVWKQLSATFASNTFLVARIVRATSMDEFEIKIKRNKELHPEDMRAVEERCSECEAISPMMRRTDTVKRASQVFYDANISGVSADMPKIQSVELTEGRFITEFDVAHTRYLAVIGSKIRDDMFGPSDPLGKDIKIGADSFTVVGMEGQKGNVQGRSMDNTIYIPYTTFLKKYGPRQSITFQVRASSEEALQAAEDEVRQILRARHKLRPNKDDDFDILTSSAIQETIDRIIGMIAVAIIPITLIGLVVGGIVVMNIMLVTVTERTVEVGMRKAVGARRSDILLQFLIESALLATLGGVLGLGFAYILCAIIESTVGFPMQITASYVLLAILTSGGVGMVSGIYPAYRASKLSPIAALARE